MVQDRNHDAAEARDSAARRQIDCAGEPRWWSQPDIVVRERATIVEPLPDAEVRRV